MSEDKEVIAVGEKFAIARSNILYVEWQEAVEKGETIKGLVIRFNPKSENNMVSYTLMGVEAEVFWKEYTGSNVMWSEAVNNRRKNEEMRARRGLPIHWADPRNAEFEK